MTLKLINTKNEELIITEEQIIDINIGCNMIDLYIKDINIDSFYFDNIVKLITITNCSYKKYNDVPIIVGAPYGLGLNSNIISYDYNNKTGGHFKLAFKIKEEN